MLRVDDDTPLYRQICEHIRTAIRTGQLRPGDRLPLLTSAKPRG
jgi:DNA-binding transcriptional regulator YhcF (GntR family)